jgi:hypothetical protein
VSECASLPVLSPAHRESHDGRLPSFAREILRYLREHAEAQDTVEGIMGWWISERTIKQWLPHVRKSFAALVACSYLERRTAVDGRVFHRLNQWRGSTKARFTEMNGTQR